MEDRMDTTFYKPEFLEAENVLKANPLTITIDEIALKIKDGPGGWNVSKEDYTSNPDGIPFLGVGDIKDGFSIENATRIFKQKHIGLKASALKPNDVLLSVRGTPGFSAVVPKDIKECNISASLVLIRLKKDANSYYISTFLSSKYGLFQTFRLSCKAVQPDINLSEVRSIKIPIPSSSFQSSIESLIKTAHEKRKEAEKKLQEAEEILEKELGWKELELNHDKAFETSFSHLERRFDPEYFKSRYERIKEVLISKNANTLSEAVKVITKRADFRKIPNKTIRYVAIADIDSESSQIVSHTKMLAYQAPSRATYAIKEGFILTATSGNSTGTKRHASCFVTKKEDGFICTNGLVPLQPKEGTEPLYLLFYLKSPFFLEQVRRELTGAAIPAISLEYMKQVLVYLPLNKIQAGIAKLVETSNQLRTESRDLIEQAKKEVENMIEKDTHKLKGEA